MNTINKGILTLGTIFGLGIASLPMGGYALMPSDQNDGLNTPKDDTASVTFSAQVSTAISIRLDSVSKSVQLAPHAADETQTTVATISTNDEAGYTLSIADANNGTLNKPATDDYTAKSILAYNGTLAAGTSAWGYKVTDAHFAGEEDGTITIPAAHDNTYAAFSSASAQIASADKRAANSTVTVTYGVSTADDQSAGTYSDVITYTAAVATDAAIEPSVFDPCSTAVGDTCNVNNTEYVAASDGHFWTTSSVGSVSTPDAEVCPAETHLPSASDYYNLLTSYGGEPDTSAGAYGVNLTPNTQLLADMGWSDGFYITSTYGDAGYWAVYIAGNYAGLDDVFAGVLPTVAHCVSD